MTDLANQVQWTALQDDEGQAFVPGTFLWALDQMVQGKKVRRRGWTAALYVHMHCGVAKDEKGLHLSVHSVNWTATDWELYEEPEQLGKELVEEIGKYYGYGAWERAYEAMYGGDSVERLVCTKIDKEENTVTFEMREEWALYRKDRALEQLEFVRFIEEGVYDYISPSRKVTSSEGMYWLPTDTRIFLPQNATDEEWAESIKEAIEEFRQKYEGMHKDPEYYSGDAGDEQDQGNGWYGWTSRKEIKCECGSEKAKVPGHSTWCPKYNKEESE